MSDDLTRFANDCTVRSESDAPPILHGHFAVFDQWTEIRGDYEGDRQGRLMERIAPGAFKRTFAAENGDRIKVLYEHGFDPQIGNKPLGPVRSLTQDSVGAAYEVELIDTDYNRNFIIPAAKSGQLGASFRFQIMKQDMNRSAKASAHNPDALPERTLLEAKVKEFGPVTFGAYEAATAGIRSRGDYVLWQTLDDEGRAELIALLRRNDTPDLGAVRDTDVEPVPATPAGMTPNERQRVLILSGVLNGP